jgi:hypothetical protein
MDDAEFNENKKELYDLLDFNDTNKSLILQNLIDSYNLDNAYNIEISNDVYTDTTIDTWSKSLPVLNGSKLLANKFIHNPINNKNVLYQRQRSYSHKALQDIITLDVLKDYENDVLWIYKLNDEIKTNNLIHVLFPSTFMISYINYIEPLIELYHMYKIYFIPLNIIIYPILSLFAPLYYLNTYLSFNMSFSTYLGIMMKLLKYVFSYSGSIKSTLIKIISVSAYIFLFGYNIYQTAEYSYMLYDVKSTLYKKLCNLNIFIKEAADIIKMLPKDIIKPFMNVQCDIDNISMDNSFPNIYKLWKSNELKNKISDLLITIYTIDVVSSINKIVRSNEWTLPTYDNHETKIWNMKNPILASEQVANPVQLSKNIIITGPNAAGKTTYVKSILSNIILSQTFGIVYGIKANIALYDNIASFMRITDILGSKSYFEAEAEYCLKMMKKAKEMSDAKKRCLFLMDEPMHSTPPTEGMATAYAVAEYIGSMSGINIILTTHFHKLTQLAIEYPKNFMNLSVEAIPMANYQFVFPYQIKKGYSYQCIAIELLSSKDFPEDVIKSAINMKNKICEEINSR